MMWPHRSLALIALIATTVAADPAVPDGRWHVGDPGRARAMLDRLLGHHVGWRDGVLMIDDVAGEGRPWIGVVERRRDGLWLRGQAFAWRLRGSLARPRLMGPGYLMWATGAVDGDDLQLHRIGVLAPPRS
jgi:hypothetical protein